MDSSLIPIAVAATAPLGAYLLAMRRFSGSIESSEAKELWGESRSIREWSQEMITQLTHREIQLEARVVSLEGENKILKAELVNCQRVIEDLKQKLEDARA